MNKIVHSFLFSVHRKIKTVIRQLTTDNLSGFTLIEILTVITIISILAGMGYTKFDSARDKSMDAKRKGDLAAVKTALVSYYQDHEAYPGSCAAPCTGVQAEQYSSDIGSGDWGIPGLSPEYIKAAPNDPRQSGIFQTMLAIVKGTRDTAQNLLAHLPKFQGTSPPQKQINTHPQVAAATSAKSPTTTAIVTGGLPVAWTVGSQTNVMTSDNVYATATGANNQGTQYIQATGFGFTTGDIPANAVINGITVGVEAKGSNSTNVYTSAVSIVKAGAIISASNQCDSACSSSTPLGTTDAYRNFGSATNLWGQTWTPADIQASNFGVAYAARFTGATNVTVSVDHIRITVNYTLPTPSVTTTAATSITTTTATLNGSANPNGYATTGYFRYSTTSPGICNDTFGTRSPTTGGTALGSGSTAVSYSQTPTGLTPNTTYYFCAIANSANGTSFGSVLNFLTLPTAPTVTTNSQTNVTSSTATLNGTVNPNGGSTNGWFRYGTSNVSCSSLPTVTTSQALGTGSVNVALSQAISGLSPSTTYYFCAVANNAGGTTYGTVLNFTTSTASVTADIFANLSNGPVSINWNSAATLSWTSTSATSCSVSPGGWTGTSLANPPGQSTGNLTTNTTYTLTCMPGSVTDSVVVNVGAQPSVTISATPSTMPWSWGGTGTISWNGTAVSTCSVIPSVSTPGPSGSGPVGPLTTDTTYTVTCDSGAATNSVTVTVGGAPAWTNACNEKDYIYCYVVSPDHLHFFLYAKLDRPKADDAILPGSACETNMPTTSDPKKPFNFCIEDPK